MDWASLSKFDRTDFEKFQDFEQYGIIFISNSIESKSEGEHQIWRIMDKDMGYIQFSDAI